MPGGAQEVAARRQPAAPPYVADGFEYLRAIASPREAPRNRGRHGLDVFFMVMRWGQRWSDGARRAFLALVAPAYCAACDVPVHEGETFCEACGACPPAPASVALGATVGGAYAPPLSTAIRRLKFGQRTDLAGRLSALLPSVMAPAGSLVVPVPLHLTRLVERGYNPPGLLGARWCRRLGLEHAPGLLSRWRDTPHQSHLPAPERARNVEGAFIAHASAAGRHAILLDDVVTTGATLEACRHALYAAGVVHVTVVALAATPLVESSRG